MDSSELNRTTEHFDFGSSAGDFLVSSSKRNVRSEVSNKDFDPEAVIDAFEMAKGIKRRSRESVEPEQTFKNIILDPEQQRDQDMLNELLNNKKYTIIQWKDTWTNQGTFRVFVIYSQRTEKEEKK
jgi:hypothetical protein